VIALKNIGDYVVLILVSASVGALGGFAAALVPTKSPGVSNPRWLTGSIVGAVAAVAVLVVLPGTTTTTTVAAGKTTTTVMWSLLRAIPVAIVAGWAGPQLLGAIQDRLLAVTKDAQLHATAEVAKSQLDKVASSVNVAVSGGITPAGASKVAPPITSALATAVEDGKKAIDAAAGRTET
jgi:hypothetical protein